MMLQRKKPRRVTPQPLLVVLIPLLPRRAITRAGAPGESKDDLMREELCRDWNDTRDPKLPSKLAPPGAGCAAERARAAAGALLSD